MAKQSVSQVNVEWHVGGWDALFASVDDLVRRRQSLHLADDTATPISPSGRVDRGVCAVPIYRIMIGTPRGMMFERWLPQQLALAPQPAFDSTGQPISLYKVGEAYYVRDGNRRIAQARARGQLFLRAHVVEYLIDMPTRPPEALQLLLGQERADFFARLPFPDSHPIRKLRATTLGSYDQLAEYAQRTALRMRPAGAESDVSSLARWYDELYLPVARVIRRGGVLHFFPGCGEIDLYLWAVERHGPWTEEQPLRERLRLARRSICALWLALRRQDSRTA